MDEPDWPNCTEEAFWSYVSWHLAGSGIESVLVGGAVVSIYAAGLYRSGDIDLIVERSGVGPQISEVLLGLGFSRVGRHFEHPRCRHLFVEFPPGPLKIGFDYNIDPTEREVEGRRLKLLGPTDCVKDRLAQYIHWDQRGPFEQAVLVASKHLVDWQTIREWCKREGNEAVADELFRTVAQRLAQG